MFTLVKLHMRFSLPYHRHVCSSIQLAIHMCLIRDLLRIVLKSANMLTVLVVVVVVIILPIIIFIIMTVT